MRAAAGGWTWYTRIITDLVPFPRQTQWSKLSDIPDISVHQANLGQNSSHFCLGTLSSPCVLGPSAKF